MNREQLMGRSRQKNYYLVGGFVRDFYMNRDSQDMDCVVVGATVEEMDADRSMRRVGKDFPIWIGNQGIEFSLARSSRIGDVTTFSPDTTLEEDLSKRDLTINAMAINFVQPEQRIGGDPVISEPRPVVIDPFGGLDDIHFKTLRMVSREAFREDPIRILRVARFAARFTDFRIDSQTWFEMCQMVKDGCLDNAQPERVWKELSRGLMEEAPQRMIAILRDCGALRVILPEVNALYGVPQPAQHHPEICTGRHIEQALEIAAKENATLNTRYAVLLHDVGKALSPKETLPSHHGHEAAGVPLVEAIGARLRVPAVMTKIAVTVAREHLNIHKILDVKTTTLVKIMRRCDAFRNPRRFNEIIHACVCDARGRWDANTSYADREYPQVFRLQNAMNAVKMVRGHGVAEQYKDRPEFIPAAMHALRARAIRYTERFAKEHLNKEQEQ